MPADELIRRAMINQVKSEQAIRRSKSLLKMAGRVIERKRSAPELQIESRGRDPRPFEMMLADARKLREDSRQALKQSKAARDRRKTA